MNPLFFPTLLLALGVFFLAWKATRPGNAVWMAVVGVVLSAPAVLFAIYYLKVLGEAQWFYTFRSWPYTELTAAGVGVFAGWLQYQRDRHPQCKRIFSVYFIPLLMTLCVAAPYLKQVVLRPDWNAYSDKWSEDVCLQSSESSCGPASAATLLHALGHKVTEKQIAQASFTTRRGTENWYLLRTIRRYGVDASYLVTAAGIENIRYPAIAGVVLKNAGDAGHFITILGLSDDAVVVGDPMFGRKIIPRKILSDYYTFTGFYIIFPGLSSAGNQI